MGRRSRPQCSNVQLGNRMSYASVTSCVVQAARWRQWPCAAPQGTDVLPLSRSTTAACRPTKADRMTPCAPAHAAGLHCSHCGLPPRRRGAWPISGRRASQLLLNEHAWWQLPAFIPGNQPLLQLLHHTLHQLWRPTHTCCKPSCPDASVVMLPPSFPWPGWAAGLATATLADAHSRHLLMPTWGSSLVICGTIPAGVLL